VATTTDWLGAPEDEEHAQLLTEIATELSWWEAQPLDPWQPVGDQTKLAPQFGHDPKAPREFKLTPPSRLSRKDYAGGVLACLRAFRVAYENRAHMTYTEGPTRWDGIEHQRRSIKGQYPLSGDCSSTASWGGWDGLLFVLRRLGDIFNGANFTGGYTGTLVEHGMAVEWGHTVPMDFLFWGGTIWVPQHVTVAIGGGRSFSMGHPGDPGLYPLDLFHTMPLMAIRRYIVSA